jgi:hypothetical protein
MIRRGDDRVASDTLHHGQPEAHRNAARGFDKYTWQDGLELTRYDDGRVKVGRWDTAVDVVDVSNHQAGASRGSAHVIARFRPMADHDHDQEEG